MKKLLIIFVTVIFVSTFIYATDWTNATEINNAQEKIGNGFDTFSIDLAESLSNAATLQNVWADAYIGKFFPSVIPHFGAGINMGMIGLDSAGLKAVADTLDLGDLVPSTLAIPLINAEAKIGGIILPFDLGVSIMKFDNSKLTALKFGSFDTINFDYFTFGADFRYRILKENVVLPSISVGAIYNYTSGSFSINGDDASAEIDYISQSYGLEAQVSKTLVGIVTPFAGTRLLVATANNNWKYSKDSGSTDPIIIEGLQTLGYPINDDGTISDSGEYTYSLTNYNSLDDMNIQLFAGVGINVLILQFTPSVSYDLTHNIWGATVSAHVKL